jgi:DNA helicase-2/ATP-dependent DNA helicase PcrA
MEKKFSTYQQSVFDFIIEGKGNCVINAVAGSGKTFTIVNALSLIPSDKKVLFLAFNKHIVTELQGRLQGISNVEVATLHSFGNKVVRTNLKSFMDSDKVKKYIDNQIPYWRIPEELLEGYANKVKRLVELAKLSLVNSEPELFKLAFKHGIEVFGSEIENALSTLDATDRNTRSFDFTDMLYYPIRFNLNCPQFDFVFIDECQDLNSCQQELMKKTLKPQGRFIAVGDPNQCIYGFAGSDTDSFNKLVNLPNTIQLPLSLTYRCSKKVTELAQKIVPQIQAIESAPEGIVRFNGKVVEMQSEDLVLCRMNAPLINLCIRLLKSNIKAFVKGKDIGLNLINMLKKTKKSKVADALTILWNERTKLVEKLVRKGMSQTDAEHSNFIITYVDKLEAIEALSENADSVAEVITRINSIFADESIGVCLSTIHKAKGLEANKVFIIEPKCLPAPWVTQEWETEQENNLAYVAYTRAKIELVFVPESEFTTRKIK